MERHLTNTYNKETSFIIISSIRSVLSLVCSFFRALYMSNNIFCLIQAAIKNRNSFVFRIHTAYRAM